MQAKVSVKRFEEYLVVKEVKQVVKTGTVVSSRDWQTVLMLKTDFFFHIGLIFMGDGRS